MSKPSVAVAAAALLTVACLPLGVAAQSTSGDSLNMSPAGQASFEAPGKPTRGMTQERVRREFGEPSATNAAVGDPPISRWEYAGFVVFFEYDRVIHAVSKR